MNKKNLGVCPFCKKGHIIDKERSYACTNRACGFYVHKEIKGAAITAETMKKIMETGKSDVMRFCNANGNSFNARIILEGKNTTIQFDNEYLKGRCPICGGRVQVTEKGYNCENRLIRNGINGARKCSFHINKRLCNRELTKEEVERFLKGEIDLLDGFNSSAGNDYAAFLQLSDAGYVRTCSRVSVCPKCGGTILVGPKAFNCSNFKLARCKMKIPRKIGGHELTYNEVKQLCERDDHTTDPVTITQSNGTKVMKKLTLDKDFETITI